MLVLSINSYDIGPWIVCTVILMRPTPGANHWSISPASARSGGGVNEKWMQSVNMP